mmetsp:Transcript_22860/g.61328  ORF Transcript_22860/g.61328 Transcript_22860/m.61328 type:complete len:258 (-) Transcript_22860:365-1138(-)
MSWSPTFTLGGRITWRYDLLSLAAGLLEDLPYVSSLVLTIVRQSGHGACAWLAGCCVRSTASMQPLQNAWPHLVTVRPSIGPRQTLHVSSAVCWRSTGGGAGGFDGNCCERTSIAAGIHVALSFSHFSRSVLSFNDSGSCCTSCVSLAIAVACTGVRCTIPLGSRFAGEASSSSRIFFIFADSACTCCRRRGQAAGTGADRFPRSAACSAALRLDSTGVSAHCDRMVSSRSCWNQPAAPIESGVLSDRWAARSAVED